MTDLKSLLKLKDVVDQKKHEVSNTESKQKLLDTTSTKIKTTMIGAIASLEKHLGFLWGHGNNKNLTDEETYMSELFYKIRKEILDNGNMQIKSIEKELSNYDLEWKRYSLTLPIKGSRLENVEGEKNDD